MTVFLSQKAYWELFEEPQNAGQPSPVPDGLDALWQYPQSIGQGHLYTLNLRPGLTLDMADYSLFEEVVITSSDRHHPLEFTFDLAASGVFLAERYGVWGSGLAPGEQSRVPAHQRLASVSVHLEPAVFCDWLKLSEDELPAPWRSLIRPLDQHYYERYGQPQAAMQMALQQIWHCPYQSLTKRLYLESKVWELMTLVLHEVSGGGHDPVAAQSLKCDDIERIRHAGHILQTRLDQPPSLMELARLIGINDHKLKLGFRQVFDTTVFGYLHELRLERSRQLLAAGELNVTQAARAVGFVNRSYFASAFRRRFGVNPSVYSRWQSTNSSF